MYQKLRGRVSVKKGKYSKYVQSKKRKKSSNNFGMKQRKKEILKKMNKNKTNQKKTPLKMKLKRNTESPWKLKSILFVASLITIILLVPTLIVVPSAMGNQLESETLETTQNKEKASQGSAGEAGSTLSVSVMRSDSENVETVPLETYVKGVVASEMPVDDFEIEALKAQALAARTFIVDHLLNKSDSDDSDVSDTVRHQVYKNDKELRQQWGSDYETNIAKLEEAVKATEGEILTYEDTPILPAFFSTSNGHTENSEDYWENELPYLRSVESPWDEESSKYLDQKTFTVQEVEQLLGIELPETNAINIKTSRTEGKRVDELQLNEYSFSGRDVREKLELQSSDFTIKQKNSHLIFTTQGYGHGIDMSQYGANGMDKNGKNYKEIVKHYYQDVEISTVTDTAPTLVSK